MNLSQAKKLKYGQIIYHKTLKNADGTAMRFKINGVVKLWKRSPEKIRVPLKHGLYQYYYLDENNMGEFKC